MLHHHDYDHNLAQMAEQLPLLATSPTATKPSGKTAYFRNTMGCPVHMDFHRMERDGTMRPVASITVPPGGTLDFVESDELNDENYQLTMYCIFLPLLYSNVVVHAPIRVGATYVVEGDGDLAYDLWSKALNLQMPVPRISNHSIADV